MTSVDVNRDQAVRDSFQARPESTIHQIEQYAESSNFSEVERTLDLSENMQFRATPSTFAMRADKHKTKETDDDESQQFTLGR